VTITTTRTASSSDDINVATTANPPKITVSLDTVPVRSGRGHGPPTTSTSKGTFTTFEFKISPRLREDQVQIGEPERTTRRPTSSWTDASTTSSAHVHQERARQHPVRQRDDLDGIEAPASTRRPSSHLRAARLRQRRRAHPPPTSSSSTRTPFDRPPDRTARADRGGGIRSVTSPTMLSTSSSRPRPWRPGPRPEPRTERGLEIPATSIAVQIDYLRAGNDVDVVVHDSVQGTNAGAGGNVHITLYNPPDLTTEQAGSGRLQRHFRPNIDPPGSRIRRGLRHRPQPGDQHLHVRDAASLYRDCARATTSSSATPRPGRRSTHRIHGCRRGVDRPRHRRRDGRVGSSSYDCCNVGRRESTSRRTVHHDTELVGDLLVATSIDPSALTLFSPHGIVDADGQPSIT